MEKPNEVSIAAKIWMSGRMSQEPVHQVTDDFVDIGHGAEMIRRLVRGSVAEMQNHMIDTVTEELGKEDSKRFLNIIHRISKELRNG